MRTLILALALIGSVANAYDWADYKRDHPQSVQDEADTAGANAAQAQAEQARQNAANQALVDAYASTLQTKPEPTHAKPQTCVSRQRKNISNQTEWVTDCK